ncbi:MAG: hypothetical protein ACAH59_08110 [Pseudobdellovibrionaceae bacterium]
MFKKILLALGLVVSVSANANNLETLAYDLGAAMAAQTQAQGPFDFKVGDTASYKLNMAQFINGTMVMTVKAVTADEVTITQDLDLMIQKQSCEQVINPNTGEIKKFTCNGQDQDPGNAGDVEVIETKEDTVTVPAGTFVCLYVKARQASVQGDIEQWINPKDVPVFGLVKQLAPSQFGKVTVELTSFKKM